MWWKTILGAPVAFVLCVFGFMFHPFECIGDYLKYSELDGKYSGMPMGQWSNMVRACTSIDMSVGK